MSLAHFFDSDGELLYEEEVPPKFTGWRSREHLPDTMEYQGRVWDCIGWILPDVVGYKARPAPKELPAPSGLPTVPSAFVTGVPTVIVEPSPESLPSIEMPIEFPPKKAKK